MVVAPELLERKLHWMGTSSTTTMIAISSAFRRPSGSMRTIDIAAVLHRKEAHEEKTEDHYHGHAGEVFPELARTSIATEVSRVLINNFRTELKESMLLLLHYLNRLVLDDILDIQIRRTNATVTCGSMSKGYS